MIRTRNLKKKDAIVRFRTWRSRNLRQYSGVVELEGRAVHQVGDMLTSVGGDEPDLFIVDIDATDAYIEYRVCTEATDYIPHNKVFINTGKNYL